MATNSENGLNVSEGHGGGLPAKRGPDRADRWNGLHTSDVLSASRRAGLDPVLRVLRLSTLRWEALNNKDMFESSSGGGGGGGGSRLG
ncbi:hypothetical protein AGIG_G12159 [Arapaima gigas]